MRYLTSLLVLTTFSGGAFAQDAIKDRITLNNGDVLTGTIEAMADGKVTMNSAVLGKVVVPLADIKDLSTKEQVTLQTKGGDTLPNRRIVGLEGGNLRLEGGTTWAATMRASSPRSIGTVRDGEEARHASC